MWKKSTDWIRYFKAPKVTVKYGAKALNEQLSSLKQSGAKKIANYGWRNFKRYLDTEITAVVLLESKNLDTISWSIADNYLIDGKLRCLYNSERSITYSLRRRHNLTSVGGAVIQTEAVSFKKIFSALRASVWSKNNGGAGPTPWSATGNVCKAAAKSSFWAPTD